MNLSHRDELLVQRHLDGALSPTDAAAFAARLAAEPALREGHAAANAMRGAFAAAREGAMRPRAGFKAAVLAAVRQLPTRLQLEQADIAARTVRFCRRLLLAAALLGSIGFAVSAGLLGGGAPTMQASPDEMQREIDRLEAVVRAGGQAGGVEKSAPRVR